MTSTWWKISIGGGSSMSKQIDGLKNIWQQLLSLIDVMRCHMNHGHLGMRAKSSASSHPPCIILFTVRSHSNTGLKRIR
jgi:hypothetical protein